jgi:hypothetical protein
MKQIKSEKVNPKVKDILDLLMKGAFLSSLFLFPGAALGIGPIYKIYEKIRDENSFNKWKNYKIYRLRESLKRMHEQEFIKIVKNKNYSEIKLTEKGKNILLSYRLKDLKIQKPDKWDGKWRIIIYDIGNMKKYQQNAFRKSLQKLDLFPLQKSVYITPYPCDDEIKIIRQHFGLINEVVYLTSDYLENESRLKKFFRL